MKIQEAIAAVKEGVRDGLRGPGCAALHATDGKVYVLMEEAFMPYAALLRFSDDGDVIERYAPPESYPGEIECITWSCDESGALYA